MSFKSWQSYRTFQSAISNSSRYIFDEQTENFLQEILNSCESRIRLVKKGSIYWRSQQGGSTRLLLDDEGNEIADIPCPLPKERMYPLKRAASDGRANPKGIPYLYLANTKETAMSEIRPWIGSEVSVAQFKTVKDLKIVDCSMNHSANPFYFDLERGYYEPNDDEKEKAVWAHIDKAFSAPVTHNENQAYYAPTQIIAELFKNNDFDGVVYKSMLGEGYNLTLFSLDSAEMLNCFLFEATKVKFKFEEAANPYFINKQSEQKKRRKKGDGGIKE